MLESNSTLLWNPCARAVLSKCTFTQTLGTLNFIFLPCLSRECVFRHDLGIL